MEKKIWQDYAVTFKSILGLEYSPVAVSLVKEPISTEPQAKKVRICRALLDAGKGNILEVHRNNNACFGASWHLGFHKIRDEKVKEMVRKFAVEREKLFCSYAALDNLISQMEDVPDNSAAQFLLSPMEKAKIQPELVIFIGNAEQACRLLTMVTFLDGHMPKIKIGGPTCRMSIIYPLESGEVNISFYDYTARKLCHVEKDKLLISIPYQLIPQMIENLDICSGGRAKVEFPQEFRQFLQKRLAQAKETAT